MSITPDWLQYGALGLLAILMVVVGWYIRDRDRFMQELVSRADAKDETRIKAWQDMTQRAVDAMMRSAKALEDVCSRLDKNDVRLESHDTRESDRHQEVMGTLRNRGRETS